MEIASYSAFSFYIRNIQTRYTRISTRITN